MRGGGRHSADTHQDSQLSSCFADVIWKARSLTLCVCMCTCVCVIASLFNKLLISLKSCLLPPPQTFPPSKLPLQTSRTRPHAQTLYTFQYNSTCCHGNHVRPLKKKGSRCIRRSNQQWEGKSTNRSYDLKRLTSILQPAHKHFLKSINQPGFMVSKRWKTAMHERETKSRR